MGLASFRKSLEKKEISVGLPPISDWLAFDNLAMNWVCTGSFKRAIPSNRSTIIAGESGATKTMNVLQLAKKAQEKGYHIILLDSETSISEQDLQMNKVDTSEESFTVIAVTTHEETLEIFVEALKAFDANEKIMFILDSINGLMTANEDEAFDKGKTNNDMGRIVQANKKLLKAIGNRIRHRNWVFISTAHVYLNQDVTNGKGVHIISNLGSAIYYPSLTLQLTKLDLKEGGVQTGIRVNVTTKKTRFTQLGKKVQLHLPYNKHGGGFDKYDGVVDILLDEGYIKQAGAWYSYDIIDKSTGEIKETKKFQSKNFADHAEYLIDLYESENDRVDFEMDDVEANLAIVDEHDDIE